jgi:hypothetical protein
MQHYIRIVVVTLNRHYRLASVNNVTLYPNIFVLKNQLCW